MEAKTILIADDSANDVELTMAVLAELKLDDSVVIVRDGAAALDYLYRRGAFADQPRGNPRLFLLDVKMPKMNGLDVLCQVKGDPDLKAIPVVVLTSSQEESDIARGYRLGVNAYVVKPVEYASFFAAVRELGVFWLTVNQPLPR
jgi:CheY-like chemotaxis protein